jgi:N-acetylmuramoyl-L-alanine amidase
MRLIAAIAVAVPLLLAQTPRSGHRNVTAVRHWSQGGVTRIAIEVSGDFEIRSDRLHNPDRLYYDILNARPWIASRRSFSETLDDPLVKRVRVAETAPGITRIVLELGANVEASTSKLVSPDRLMIELRAGGSAPAPPETEPATAPAPTPPFPTPPAIQQEPPKLSAPSASVKPPIKADVPAPAPAEPTKAQLAKPADTKQPGAAEPPATPTQAGIPVPLPEGVGKAARHTSAGDTSLVRTLGLKINRIVIDPGHGGHDQGTEGRHGLLEKDVVLDIARRLGKLVEERMGAEVIYTRTDDTFIPLQGRTALANEKKADLFLSIHVNSSPVARTAGVETYYLNIKGSSQDALDVAARENASSQQSVFELADIIQKIAKQNKAEESREFAGRIQAALYAFSRRNVPGARNRGVRTAPFVVLIGANMPSVLAEIGFLSNPREEALLKRPDYRQKVAEALFRGLSRYAESLSHFQVARAGE